MWTTLSIKSRHGAHFFVTLPIKIKLLASEKVDYLRRTLTLRISTQTTKFPLV